MKFILLMAATLLMSVPAFAQKDYVMSCDDVVSKLNREATEEGKSRFGDLRGSCLGVVDRDGALYMHTKMIVRKVRGNNVTLYIPATDRTMKITPESDARVLIEGQKIRPRNLVKGQELSLYVSVDAFTQPIITSIAMPTEGDNLVDTPAEVVAALPTTG